MKQRHKKQVEVGRCCWICGKLGGAGYTIALSLLGYDTRGKVAHAHPNCIAREQRKAKEAQAMARKQVSAVTRINQQLKAQGREERLVRGRGYYYIHGGELPGISSTSIMRYRIDPEDYVSVATEVQDMFASKDIAVLFDEAMSTDPHTQAVLNKAVGNI